MQKRRFAPGASDCPQSLRDHGGSIKLKGAAGKPSGFEAGKKRESAKEADRRNKDAEIEPPQRQRRRLRIACAQTGAARRGIPQSRFDVLLRLSSPQSNRKRVEPAEPRSRPPLPRAGRGRRKTGKRRPRRAAPSINKKKSANSVEIKNAMKSWRNCFSAVALRRLEEKQAGPQTSPKQLFF